MDRRRAWAMLAGLWLVATGAAAYEIVPASVAPLIRSSMGVGPTAASALVSVMFGVAVFGSIPLAVGVDRLDTRRAMVVSAAVLVLAGGWGWWAASRGDFASLLGSRALGGAAFVTIWNAGAAAVGRAFDPEVRATAIAAFTTSGPAGFGLGQFTGPLVAAAVGWEWTLVAYGVLAVVGVAVYLPASAGVSLGAGAEPPGLDEFRRVLSDARVWHVSAMAFLAYVLYLFVNSWMPTYLTEGLGVSLAASGLLTGAFAVVGVLSRLGGGAISDRLFGTRRRPVVVISFVASVPLVAALGVVEFVPLLLLAMLGAGFFVQFTLGLSLSYARELVDEGVAVTAISVATALGLAGAFVSPILAAAIFERTGSFGATFVFAVATAVLGVALAWGAPEAD